jgi:hypothetical protein
MIHFSGNFFCSHHNENFIVGVYFLFHIRKVHSKHCEMNNRATRFFPLAYTRMPPDIILNKELTPPPGADIMNTLYNAGIIGSEEHPLRAERTGSKPDMGSDPLVPLRPVP